VVGVSWGVEVRGSRGGCAVGVAWAGVGGGVAGCMAAGVGVGGVVGAVSRVCRWGVLGEELAFVGLGEEGGGRLWGRGGDG